MGFFRSLPDPLPLAGMARRGAPTRGVTQRRQQATYSKDSPLYLRRRKADEDSAPLRTDK